ncbi:MULTISPECIES: hypothetical protein [unclassified Streptomyces]|uniref:hypothetical protein n=1 Tax=unclassified Streptomyces TaxID=2593676 RepID=UPI00228654C8|nr:hypothetical protein [Streptomyces sp. Je 1-369]WAL95212.1 hypothetical protein NOO62_12345 [Streptomyces sp. Je 1-369]
MTTTETVTETRQNTAPMMSATAPTGAGRHRGPVSEHDEQAAPRGRHRRQDEQS